MKKLLSILTVLLIVTAMLHFSVAKHYCGGNLVASKFSLSGTLASCGMEGDNENCPYDNEDHLRTHCCDDVRTSYSIDNNYTPSTTAHAGSLKANIPVPVIPSETAIRFYSVKYQSWSDISPPGKLMTSSVDLPDIRVFRI